MDRKIEFFEDESLWKEVPPTPEEFVKREIASDRICKQFLDIMGSREQTVMKRNANPDLFIYISSYIAICADYMKSLSAYVNKEEGTDCSLLILDRDGRYLVRFKEMIESYGYRQTRKEDMTDRCFNVTPLGIHMPSGLLVRQGYSTMSIMGTPKIAIAIPDIGCFVEDKGEDYAKRLMTASQTRMETSMKGRYLSKFMVNLNDDAFVL